MVDFADPVIYPLREVMHGENQITFYKKQVMNKKLGLLLALLGLLYYSTLNRKAASSVRKSSATHAHYLF